MSQAPKAPPFRAEHIGSLLRPAELVEKRYDVAQGKSDPKELAPLENKSIRDIVKLQQECGFHGIGDGEFRRHQFWGTFFETLNGMKEMQTAAMEGYDESLFRAYAPDVKSFLEAKTIPNQVTICIGKISHTGTSSYETEVKFLQSILPKDQWGNIKVTLASPSWYHFRYAPARAFPAEVYKSDEEYFTDVAKAYQTELKILYGLGVRNVQVDDPNLAYFCSEAMLTGWAADKNNTKTADEMLDAYIKFYSECFQRPADMHLGIHLCRGNYLGSRHFSEGAYDRICKELFRLNANTFYLEYDTPRAGGFEPLKHLPLNKNVVLGVITSKFPQLENQQDMVDRIHKAADFVAEGSKQTREEALQRLCVSPQCGFASHAEGNSLEHEDMKRKLKLVRAIADQVWPGQP